MLSRRFPFQFLSLAIAFSLLTSLVVGQHRPAAEKPNPPAPARGAATVAVEKPAVTIEGLLAVDSYKVYGEVKNVGTLVSTGSISELIDPIMKLADPPKEFKTLVKFINANAEMLADSRLVFATWPARTGVPDAIFAIELASPEDAAKFEPKLNKVLPTILPTPTPTPAEEKSPANEKDRARQIKSVAEPGTPAETKPAPPPFVVTRSGNLVLVSDRPFKFEKLRPADSKLLTEDPNFRQVRERFSTEPVFIFFNVALTDSQRAQPVPEATVDASQEMARMEAERQAEAHRLEEKAKEETTEAQPAKPDDTSTSEPEVVATVNVQEPPTTGVLTVGEPKPAPTPQLSMMAVTSLLGLLSGGNPEWPDALGVALTQEADDYVIRSLLVGPQNGKRLVLPFVPQLFAGRSFTPAAPGILPDETEMVVSVSLDWPRTYQEMLVRLDQSNKERSEAARRLPAGHRFDAEKPYDPFVDFEKKGGFKIREDLLPALGGEIAVAGSMNSLGGATPFGMIVGSPRTSPVVVKEKETEESIAQKKRDSESAPAVLISVRDREAAKRLAPKILDGLGIGAANMIATPVRRDDTEMFDFAGAFAYAFVGDFMVISTTPTVKHIIDSYLTHQTLSSNSAFRNQTRWQPSGITGQVYISPALMESYTKAAHDPAIPLAAAMRDYLLRLNPTPQAITYAMSTEANGTTHELHLPKSLILATVAGAASASKEMSPEMNEAVAVSLLRTIASAENTFKETEGKGNYASLEKLISAKMLPRETLDKYGYRFDVIASGTTFEATATPVEYGKTGRMSYFIDNTGVVRGGDHGGGAASLSDKPME